MAADLGIFPSVAEPLVMVAPLLVIMVEAPTPLGFLYPKELLAVDLPMPEGGFFPSSPLLFPASEGDLCKDDPLRGVFPFSEALASSVFPGVLSALVLVFCLAGVPPWADMPLLQEPV